MTDYFKEYDGLVKEFNEWARSVLNAYESEATIDRIFDHISIFNEEYSELELNAKQRDAIVNGAECVRLLQRIEQVSKEDQPYARFHLESTYMVHRIVYEGEARKSSGSS